MIRTQTLRTYASASRRAPLAVRAVAYPHARKMATVPNPTLPTDAPKPSDVPKPSGGGGNTFLWGGAALAGAAVGWYYYTTQSGVDPHAQRMREEAKMKQKAQELADTGKSTAHATYKEGEKGYENAKATGKEKLNDARVSTTSSLEGTKLAIEQKYDAAKSSAKDTYNQAASKVGGTYEGAKVKAHETEQSWSQWFGSWFGYSKSKAEDAKSESALKVAEGAHTVEKEASKRV